MAQIQKIERQTKIKSSPDKVYDVFKNKTHLIPQICPDKVRSVKLIEGDGKSVGSVEVWNNIISGSQVMVKGKFLAFDDENNKFTFEVIDGDGEFGNSVKHLKATLQTVAETDTNLFKFAVEYEKINDNISAPNDIIDLAIKIAEDVDSYLVNT